MTYNGIIKWASKKGYKIEHKKYGYWDYVLHIENVAICADWSGTGSITICTPGDTSDNSETYHQFFTKNNIQTAIDRQLKSCGWVNGDYEPCFREGCKKFTLAQDIPEEYSRKNNA